MYKSLCVSVVLGIALSGCVAYEPVPQHNPSYAGDRDRDGVPNARDRDRDGDGVPNRADRRPDNPRRY